jgi:hypothetical protein
MLSAGLINGAAASFNGLNFWNGAAAMPVPGVAPAVIKNGIPAPQSNITGRASIDDALGELNNSRVSANIADDLPAQGPVLLNKGEYRLSEYYFNRLSTTGRYKFFADWADFAITNPIEPPSVVNLSQRPGEIFYKYVSYNPFTSKKYLELVYNPTTREIWHLTPTNKIK